MSSLFDRLHDLFAAPKFHTAVSTNPLLREKLANEIKDNSSVLEFGCGDGLFARELLLRRKGVSYLGVDTEKAYLREARKHLSSEPKIRRNRNSFEFYRGDMGSIGFLGSLSRCDYVLFFEVLCYLTRSGFERSSGHDPVRDVVKAMPQILNRHGIVLIVEPASHAGLIPGFKMHRTIDQSSLTRCLEEYGFEVQVNRLADDWLGDSSGEVKGRFFIRAVLK